jgi:hypothetical protein
MMKITVQKLNNTILKSLENQLNYVFSLNQIS